MFRSFCAGSALAGALLLGACDAAPDTPTSRIAVSQPWSRETAPGQAAGGAFMTITNSGTADDRLIGGSSSVVGEVQVHNVTLTDGVMRMRQLPDGLAIPAGETVTLAPGGYHLMLMRLTQPIERTGPVPLTLEFERAGAIEVTLAVQSAGAKQPGEAGND